MISAQSDLKQTDKVSFFSVFVNKDERNAISNILKPIKPVLGADKDSSIFVFKDGETIHAEALVYVNGGLIKSQSIGTSVQETLEKLISKTIKQTSIFRRSKKNMWGELHETI